MVSENEWLLWSGVPQPEVGRGDCYSMVSEPQFNIELGWARRVQLKCMFIEK
jgi:hypothetical protein